MAGDGRSWRAMGARGGWWNLRAGDGRSWLAMGARGGRWQVVAGYGRSGWAMAGRGGQWQVVAGDGRSCTFQTERHGTCCNGPRMRADRFRVTGCVARAAPCHARPHWRGQSLWRVVVRCVRRVVAPLPPCAAARRRAQPVTSRQGDPRPPPPVCHRVSILMCVRGSSI